MIARNTKILLFEGIGGTILTKSKTMAIILASTLAVVSLVACSPARTEISPKNAASYLISEKDFGSVAVEPPKWEVDFTQFGDWGYGNYLLDTGCPAFKDYQDLVSGAESLGSAKFTSVAPSVRFETQNLFEVYNQIIVFESEDKAKQYLDLLAVNMPDTSCSNNGDSVLTQYIKPALGVNGEGFVAENLSSQEFSPGSVDKIIFVKRGSAVAIISLYVEDDADYVGGFSVNSGNLLGIKAAKRFLK